MNNTRKKPTTKLKTTARKSTTKKVTKPSRPSRKVARKLPRQAGLVRGKSLWQYMIAACFVVVFMVIGTLLLTASRAASTTYNPITGIGSKCLDDWKGSTIAHNKVDLFTCNGSTAQQWSYNANGTITNVNGNCLNVYHSGTTDGTSVDLLACNGTVAQQWTINTSTHALVNPHSAKCLDDTKALTTDGNPVQLWGCNGQPQQAWIVTTTTTTGGGGGTGTPPPPPPPPSSSVCQRATGPFTVSGTTVKQANGQLFMPYGATLSTLQSWPQPKYDPNKSDTAITQSEKQIKAIAGAWCGNTVRLQIEQDEVVGLHDNAFNASYMSAIRQVVSYAESLGLVVVINAQTEPGGSTTTGNESMATNNTKTFWHDMDQYYAKDPQVIYDLFNEPRNSGSITSSSSLWSLWRNGNSSYVGMQPLINYVRSDGAKNLFWIEGEGYSNDFQYIIQNAALRVTGSGLVYEMHDPTEGGNSTSTVSSWNTEFGNFVNKGIAPVVEGEWTEYSVANWQCWSNAPTAVPQYLNYLASLHSGLTMWTLAKPFMLSNSNAVDNYNTPNRYSSGYSCTNGLGQGAGQDVQNWFLHQNK